MELSETLRRRRMARAFDPDRPVDEAALAPVLAAALRAPSAGFTQAVSLLVLTSAAERDAFWTATAAAAPGSGWLTRMRTAPVLALVWTSEQAYRERYAEPDKGWTDRDAGPWSAPYWFVDAGMATMAVLLAAVDAGLGAAFFGVAPDRAAAVREAFGVPADQLSVGVVALGHPAVRPPGPGGSATRRPRRPATELLHRGRWPDGAPLARSPRH